MILERFRKGEVMNKVVLMGRLTKDPETRYSTNGSNTAVCRFSIAVDRKFQKPGEEKKADFIPVVAFGKTGEFVSKYFTKGSRIAVVGAMQTRTWDDSEGKKHYTTEVIAEEVHFADSKQNNRSDAAEPEDGFYPPEEEDPLPF